MTPRRNTVLTTGLVVVGAFIVYAGIFYYQHVRSGQQVPIPVQTSVLDEGTTTEDANGTATTTSTTASPCIVGGCSNEICSDQPVIGNCIYKAEFACYRTAKCERQESGSCGWTQTPGLLACLNNGGAAPSSAGTTTAP